MESSVLTSVVLPAALFLIMGGMGLSLTLDDFRRVARFPRAAAVGLVAQLVGLPLCAWACVELLGGSGTLAVGAFLLAACPGGVTSNLVTHVARGDTALSITLTAINSCVAVFTLPLIVQMALRAYLGADTDVELPILRTIGQVVAVTLLPVALGMSVRRARPSFADRMERPARIASSLVFVVVALGIIASNVDLLREHFHRLAGLTLSLNLSTMVLGWALARLSRLPAVQVMTVAIEAGIQNSTLAIVIATGILRQPDMALVAGIYGLVMFLSGGALMVRGFLPSVQTSNPDL